MSKHYRSSAPMHDHRQELTDEIIALIEAGAAPWQQPWKKGQTLKTPQNFTSGKDYRGVNHLRLILRAFKMGYNDNRWMSYLQAQTQGWQVRKGERGSTVTFFKPNMAQAPSRPEERAEDVAHKNNALLLRYTTVFNACQIEGIPAQEPQRPSWEPNARAQEILDNSGAKIAHLDIHKAYYRRGNDTIYLPHKEQFACAESYYATALHELGHWSGHYMRLNRDMGKTFGTAAYAREELRAELASFFLSSHLGICHDPSSHASYVSIWIEILKKDKTEIFKASHDASKIVDYILQFQPQTE
jgi:antirestriction protein ArdC